MPAIRQRVIHPADRAMWAMPGSKEEKNAGAQVNLELLKAGVIVRPVGNYDLPQWLRISIGLPEENETFISALKKILKR